jgi:hypothetical protein
MAEKFIRHGETYYGDGTTSHAASSNGGVGAWNNINIFEGSTPTYGSLNAGDVVYIRSKDAGGADITRTISGNTLLGSTTATETNPISWIIDGGTKWSGVDGTVKYEDTSGVRYIEARVNNIIGAENQDKLILHLTSTYPIGNYIYIKGWLRKAKVIAGNTVTSEANIQIASSVLGRPATAEDVHFVVDKGVGARIYTSDHFRLLNPDIEMVSNAAAQSCIGVDTLYSAARLEIIGGRVRGSGAGSMTTLFNVVESNSVSYYGSTRIRAVGFDVPKSMPVSNYGLNRSGVIEMIGLDGGIGAHHEETWGWATSRTDNNPPYLSAQLPDSGLTEWSWRVYPKAASFNVPLRMPFVKMFQDTAAAQTITLEVLVATTLSPTKKSMWMTVDYMDDSTGLPKHISTFDVGASALDSSSAAWSATVWGVVSFNKRKLEIDTPTAVRQDSVITVCFYFGIASATDLDILFVDPDFAVNPA